jgi:sec-independent protein translocase protein TatA
MFGITTLGIFQNLGIPELLLIAVIALLVFGPRLPTVMRSIGKGIVEFKKGLRDTGDDISREVDTPSTSRSDKQIDHKSNNS